VEAVVNDQDDELYLASDTFEPILKAPSVPWDDDEPDREASTYQSVGTHHGPRPVPDWVITEDRARQYEHGLLKSGKEADVYLVERSLGDRTNLLAAKRYRQFEDRMFRNDTRYRQNRRTGESRVDKALVKGTRVGMAFRAQQWVETEFEVLGRLWSSGVSVPYPVQRLGREVMLEYLGDESQAAPRLVHFRGSRQEFEELYHQLLANLTLMTEIGVVHSDLSPYNLLVWNGTLYVIDLPQAVDPILNPEGLALLERDVLNTCGWFQKRGVPADPSEVLGDLIARLF
jgi:RIO kinase 1